MKETVIVDTGPIVAYLARGSHAHDWAREQAGKLPAPWYTCEPVLTEAAHLLRRHESGGAQLLAMLQRGLLKVSFRLEPDANDIERLLAKYNDIPMSLADACLVRMSESIAKCRVLTLDSDFRIYRRHGRRIIPTQMPPLS